MDAAKAKNEAVSNAKAVFSAAITSCKGACYESYRSTYSSCVGPFKATAEQCVTAAEGVFSASVVSCQSSTSCGAFRNCYANAAFQTCLVSPRVTRRLSVRACATTGSA